MSGHTTPDAKRRYAKRTESQRLVALRKRRAWRQEQIATEIQNEAPAEIQNGGGNERQAIEDIGRSGEIRTPDPLLPKQVRYQAALRSARPQCPRRA